jgi:hypothetical protein
MMLEHLGYPEAGQGILRAIEQCLMDGPRTPDLGGNASTEDVGKAIAEAIWEFIAPLGKYPQHKAAACSIAEHNNAPIRGCNIAMPGAMRVWGFAWACRVWMLLSQGADKLLAKRIPMALTLSNRETFLVLNWIEEDEARMERCRRLATQACKGDAARAVPRLSDAIYSELKAELPDLDGIVREMLESGLRRVNFYELAMVFVLETGAQPRFGPTLPV